MFFSSVCFAQVETPQIRIINQKIDSLDEARMHLLDELETLKLGWIQTELDRVGVPQSSIAEKVIEHAAYRLSYNESHEQANWVTHIILPEISTGNASRSNDFRVDPLVSTGTAIEKDYFTKTKKTDGEFEYDGFGYDRGHLAPSADFRWSEKALSESYFYSNMSPQIGDFNRLKWAELENWMREYVITNNTYLIIVTAPVLTEGLPKIERGINKVSIPKAFIKVALDVKNQRGVGFILPHQKIENSLETYAVSIDSVENLLGYDLFGNLEDNEENTIESQNDYQPWLPNSQKNSALPIALNKLPKNAVNTQRVNGLVNSGRTQKVCGTVVSTKKHKKGHVFIDLDKKFPNQVFSVSIFTSSIKNFDYEPEVYLLNKQVCFSGKIGEYNDTPNMIIEHEKQVELFQAGF